MERKGDFIQFDDNEQLEFNVPAQIEVPIALQTASAFEDAAAKVRRRAENMADEVEDDDSRSLSGRETLFARAWRLETFSKQILETTFKEN